MSEKTRIGVIGCGRISGAYLRASKLFDHVEVVACADLLGDRAKERAEEYGIPKALEVDELLEDPDVQVVVNLTVPAAHAPLNLRALEAGKHAYTEKPFAVNREEAQQVLALAKAKGLLTGGAPDTFLGGGHQTCRRLIDEGMIGEPIAATAFFASRGPERGHPDPEFFYKPGGGPMFDMGPYYLTAMVNMFGPVKSVASVAKKTWAERVIQSEPKRGQVIKVEVPSHVSGVALFENGVAATMITSWDMWGHHLPRLEVHGSEGSLSVPDPNFFKGPVYIKTEKTDWEEVEVKHPYTENMRSIGAADLAAAALNGRTHRASGDLAYHVLDVMLTFHEAGEQRRHLEVQSTCARPAPIPVDLREGTLD